MTYILFILYNFTLWVILPVLLILILVHSIVNYKEFRAYLYKLSIKTISIKQPNIWIHSVSAGEVASIVKLVDLLKGTYNIFITTTTSSGMDMAIKLFPNETLSYYPFDYGFFCKRVIRKVNPSGIIFIETEIWPNMLKVARLMDIPTFLISGRMGVKEYKRYKILGSFFREVFNLFTLITMHSNDDSKRIRELGVCDSKISIIKSLKFDIKRGQDNCIGYRVNKSFVIIASSTHPKEEDLVINVYKCLLIRFPFLKLIIVPRHPRRAISIIRLLSRHKLTGYLRTGSSYNNYNILVVDTIGELISFYNMSDIVILGGTFNHRIGGHNPIEPCYLKKPVIVGPYTYNFESIISELISKKGVIQIDPSDKKDYTNKLFYYIEKLITDNSFRTSLANNGYKTISSYNNTSRDNFNLIMSYL